MIHLLNYKGEIINFISNKENVVLETSMTRQTKESVETFDFTLLSDRAEGFNERNRIVVTDKNEDYREFIITSVSENKDGTTEVESQASYIEDISKAKPFKPGKFEKMTASEALTATLVDTGWETSEETEWDGIRTTSWTEYKAPYEVLQQLTTTYKMVLDFKVTLGANRIEKREVTLRKANPLFQGKEITHGKDLETFQRISDFTEVNTALLAIGPEKEDGTRLELVVVDDEAQTQFGLNRRYIWGLYEPESDDQAMTEARLRTLATTELNKRKTQAVSYEISSINLLEHYPHEIIRLGDIVRIKDRTFNPPLYAEAEVISEEYDAISNVSTYTFGQVVEYSEASLRKYFLDKLDLFTKKTNDDINGAINIITDRIDEEVERLQDKIHRGPTAPDNPKEGDFWYDTSNPRVAVLREYKNGKWENASAHDVEQIGGLRREVIIYRQLLEASHSMSSELANQMERTNATLISEYLVDIDVKNQLQNANSNMLSRLQVVVNYIDSMTEETATMGALMDWQSALVDLRNDFYYLVVALVEAEEAIAKQLKILQAQYSDEKFQEAMQNVADKFGFTKTDDGLLVGDSTLVSGAIQALRDDTEAQFRETVKKVDYETDQNNIVQKFNSADAERLTLANQIKDRVTLTEYNKTKDKIDNLKVGGKNLVLNSYGKYINHTSYGKYYDLSEDWIVGENYTVTIKGQPNTNHYFGVYTDDGYTHLCNLVYNEKLDLWIGTGIAKTSNRNKPKQVSIYDMPKDGNYKATIQWIKVEKGTVYTDYEKAPEDTDERLKTMETSISQNGTDINLKASKEEFNKTKQTLSKTLSEIIINTTDGVTLSYDANGLVNDLNVGPNGVIIKGDKINLSASKQFNLLVSDVTSKVDKNSIVSSINATPERIDINTQNVGIFGGSGQSYIKIKNDEIESSGRYTRTWFDKTTTNNVRFRVRNGYSYMENIDEDKRLYFTDKGISTFISGYSDENPNYESHGSGVIEFFSHQYDPDIRGLTLFSNRGTIALQTKARDIILDSDRDIRLNTNRGSIFLEMNNTNRPGDNTFNFYIKDNDSASDTDGVFRFGSKRLNYSSGLRFEKTIEGKPMIYVTNGNGDKYTGSIDVVDIHVRGDIRAPQDLSLRTIDGTGYRALTASTYASYNSVAFRSHSGRNVYFGVGLNELRITDNNGFQENDTRYKPLLASDFVKASREEFKEDIKLWDYDALNVIVKELQLYSYKYKNDERGLIQHGPVIGDQYETPSEFIFGDGVNTNEMISFSIRAIQQLHGIMELQAEEIEKLKEKKEN